MAQELALMNIDYKIERGIPVIYLFCRNRKKERVIVRDKKFKPWFLVTKNAPGNKRKLEPTNIKTIGGEPLFKIITDIPSDVAKERELFEKTFESDILFPQRYLIDKSIYDLILDDNNKIIPCKNVDVEPRVFFLDIETVNNKVICLTIYDSYDKKYTTFSTKKVEETIFCSSEKTLLRNVVNFVIEKDPDIFSGWWIEGFDLPVLIKRMQALNVNFNNLSPLGNVITEKGRVKISGKTIFDLLTYYKKFFATKQFDSYKLEDVAQRHLGYGKIKIDKKKMAQLWQKDPEKLIKYNKHDVRLCVELNDVLNLISFYNAITKVVGMPLESTKFSSRIVDVIMLRQCKGVYGLPQKVKKERVKYSGGYVLTPKAGVHKNVVNLDLKATYPSIIINWNISPETLTNDPTNAVKVGSVYFKKEPIGILPQALMGLYNLREEYRRRMEIARRNNDKEEAKKWDINQYALKQVVNAIYGVFGYPGFRLYDVRIAQSITFLGREILKTVKQIVENLGFEVCYSDTDSVFISVKGNPRIEGAKIEKIINEKLKLLAPKQDVDLIVKLEKIYKNILFAKKKRYAGILENRELDVKGFSCKRSDSSQFSRNLQKELLTKILKHEDYQSYLKSIDIRNIPINDLGIPCGITKDLDSYETNCAHVRAAKYSIEHLGLDLSSKPKRIYVKRMPPGYPQTDVLAFDDEKDLPDGIVIDYEKMKEKIIEKKTETILDAIGASWFDIMSGTKQTELSKWT